MQPEPLYDEFAKQLSVSAAGRGEGKDRGRLQALPPETITNFSSSRLLNFSLTWVKEVIA
jgi:hypothetical protein